jgi:hypothetical protein
MPCADHLLDSPVWLSSVTRCRIDTSLTAKHSLGHTLRANPTPPSLVAQKIREIIESETWQFRHPIGPDAAPFLGWRGAMTDEDWVNWAALDDNAWYERVQRDFNLDAHPKKFA